MVEAYLLLTLGFRVINTVHLHAPSRNKRTCSNSNSLNDRGWAKKKGKQNDRQNDRAWAKKKMEKPKWSPKMIAHQNDREFFFHDYVDQIPRLCTIILVGIVCRSAGWHSTALVLSTSPQSTVTRLSIFEIRILKNSGVKFVSNGDTLAVGWCKRIFKKKTSNFIGGFWFHNGSGWVQKYQKLMNYNLFKTSKIIQIEQVSVELQSPTAQKYTFDTKITTRYERIFKLKHCPRPRF